MIETTKLDSREQHFLIPGDRGGLRLFLRYLGPASISNRERIVLYVHGATFSSALSVAHRFDGHSWRDELNAAGFHVWGLDFQGYGGSDRYPEMSQAAEDHPPLGRAHVASLQVENAVKFIAAHHSVERISIIAYSWGSMAAGLFAGRFPELVERIVFFAPIAQRSGKSRLQTYPAWHLVSLQEQWDRFVEDVPSDEQPVLSREHFDEWGPQYLDSDPDSRVRSPHSVKVPCGPVQEIGDAFVGHLAYDPALIRAPVAIIRGAWDHLVTDEDARWLFDALKASPLKRDVKISRSTHLMHLEESRYALYRETQIFLEGGDRPSSNSLDIPKSSRGKTRILFPEEDRMKETNDAPHIPGYTYGTSEVAKSPITMEEWQTLKKSALFSDEDVLYLRLSKDILAEQVEDLLKAWRGVIFLNPHLRAYDEDPQTGEVDKGYAAAVAKRFGQWVMDTANAEYDQAWLNYQYEIGLRHHRTKKNKTDNAHTLNHIRARDLIAFSAAIVVPMKPFLAKKGHPAEVVDRMYNAWWKSMILQVTLWSQPYIREGDF